MAINVNNNNINVCVILVNIIINQWPNEVLIL